jgi:hypothetical protein
MTEEPKIRLFSITVHAWRLNQDGNSEVNIQNVVALATSDVDIAQIANDHAHQVYPTAEGWKSQQSFWTEIPHDARLGPFHLTWQAELVDDNTNSGRAT